MEKKKAGYLQNAAKGEKIIIQVIVFRFPIFHNQKLYFVCLKNCCYILYFFFFLKRNVTQEHQLSIEISIFNYGIVELILMIILVIILVVLLLLFGNIIIIIIIIMNHLIKQ